MKYNFRYFALMPLLVVAFRFPGKKVNSTYNKINIIFKDSLFDMCMVMPGDEVASLSPFSKPIKQVTPDDRLEGYCGCHYDLQSDDDYPQVQISLNEFSSARESKENYVIRKEDWVNLYQRQPEFIPNLGDSASFYGNADPALCDDCGLQVASGHYYITVAFKGYYDKIPAATKKNSSVNIVRKLFEKKPYLNSRR
ncbi:MAG TPA: hypothetical protein VLJ68_07200 [Chitinophagaceae bacterium]|nr:hypothetical protein [Chitinophagaceae bacterium]